MPRSSSSPQSKSPRLDYPAIGESILQTFQKPKAVDLFEDDVIAVHWNPKSTGYNKDAKKGDPHPDTDTYPDHTLEVIELSEDGEHATFIYVRPKASLVSHEINERGETVTVTDAFVDEDADPATASELTLDVKEENLSNGRIRRIIRSVASFFNPKVRGAGTRNVIPERFWGANGVNEVEDTVAGTVPDSVTLSSGEIERKESQLTKYLKRVVRTVFNIDVVPTLNGQDYDEVMNVPIPYQERIEPSGTSLGSNKTEVHPISPTADLVKTINPDTSVLDNYVLSFPGRSNVELPDVLEGVTFMMEKSSGSGDYNESGSGVWEGRGSVSLPIKGTGQASAALMPEAVISRHTPNGKNVSVSHYLFFLPAPVTEADVIAKLETLIGSSVSAWPLFNPRPASIVLVGQHLSLQCNASAFVMTGGSSDPAALEAAQSSGKGSSQEVSLTIKTYNIPECIHPDITVSGATVDQITITATAQAVAGPISANISKNGQVVGRVYYNGLGATGGTATSIPTTGLYLYDCDAEPYRYGYVKIRVIVLNAVNLPSSVGAGTVDGGGDPPDGGGGPSLPLPVVSYNGVTVADTTADVDATINPV